MRLPDAEEIGRALAAAGLAGPWEVRSVPALGARVARCLGPGGADLLVRFVEQGHDRGPERAVAAHARAPAVVPPSRALRFGGGAVAVAQPAPTGRPAAALSADEGARAVGVALARLHAVEAGPRGGGASLLPTAGRWSDELVAGASRDADAARAVGADLGRRSESLLGCVEARAEALDAPTRAVLVHGLATPTTVWVDEAGGATLALGFEAAWVGDAEQDLAPLLFVPGFEQVAAGYGAAAIGAMAADDASIARLEAHLARFLLARLAADPDAAEQARIEVWAARLLEGGVGDRVRGGAEPAPAGPDRVLARAALRALARRPDPPWAEPVHGALACALLAARHPPSAAGWLRLGLGLLDAVPPGPEHPDVRPIPGPERAATAARARAALAADPPGGQPVAAGWLVAAAEALVGATSAGLPRAVARHVEGLAAARSLVGPSADADTAQVRRLLHHLLAVPAHTASRPEVTAAAAALRWPALADQGLAGDLDTALAEVSARPALAGPAQVLPVLLLAHALAGDDLARDVPPAALAALLR
jgi:hypothetical protein